MLQSAAPKIPSIVTPWVEAADVYALLVECVLSMLMSIPVLPMISFGHLAMVDDVTGLCGLIKETKSCVASPHNSLVFSR